RCAMAILGVRQTIAGARHHGRVEGHAGRSVSIDARCLAVERTRARPLRLGSSGRSAHASARARRRAHVTPNHPLVSDAAARALLQALMNAELLGVALLRGPSHVHAMLNAKYESLMGCPVLGRSLEELLPGERSPSAILERVHEGHGPALQRQVPLNDGEHY